MEGGGGLAYRTGLTEDGIKRRTHTHANIAVASTLRSQTDLMLKKKNIFGTFFLLSAAESQKGLFFPSFSSPHPGPLSLLRGLPQGRT